MTAPLAAWPWDNLSKFKACVTLEKIFSCCMYIAVSFITDLFYFLFGFLNEQYLLYAPLIAKSFNSWGEKGADSWCIHILAICDLRGVVHQLWFSYSNMLFLTNKHRVIKQGVDYKQIDREWNWDNFIILQALVAAFTCYASPFMDGIPLFNFKGYLYILILHVGITEVLYYWIHRIYHTGSLFRCYHSLHHSCVVSQPFTGGVGTFLEHLVFTPIMGIPLMGASCMGGASITMFYGYVLAFDFLMCMGHCNVEVVPVSLFEYMPILRYLLCTPSYHSLHHTDMNSNFSLFMPIYDLLGNTLNKNSWDLHRSIRSGKDVRVPDFVFLVHIVDIHASIHSPFFFRSFNAHPFTPTNFLVLTLWPLAFTLMLCLWAWATTFTITFYSLRNRLVQTWLVRRYGFQYFLQFARHGINRRIEDTILNADKIGVKVIGLGALNKNEALNGGGTLFVRKHPDLRVKVVHGNTLTAAVILNEIPKDVKEVFLTGATSKLGRAIALYLCRYSIRVLMLTVSAERFQDVQKEAPIECQKFLVHVMKYQAAQNCKRWIVGKWISPSEQKWAPSATHFHQFVVPPIPVLRRDCTYGKLAAMRLPDDVQGLGACEYTMERSIVHACHAGGLVHLLEAWDHHEVGAIDIGRIDLVWNCALKQGLRPVS